MPIQATILSFVLIAALLCGCAGTASQPDTAAMIAAAAALDKAYEDAYNRADADALAALFWDSPEMVTLPPDTMMLKGVATLRGVFAKEFETMKGAKLALTESHHIAGADMVASWGLWTLKIPGADGTTVELKGRYSDVKAMRNGKWVYLMDHASSPAPAVGGGQ